MTHDAIDDDATGGASEDRRAAQASDASPGGPITDPGTLRARDDVEFREEVMVHADEDHCGVAGEGRVIVGVTGSAGDVLLLVHRAAAVATLPNGRVDAGDEWAGAARRAVDETTGVDVELAGPVVVRAIEHYVATGDDSAGGDRPSDTDEPRATSFEVLFRASPAESGAGDGQPHTDDDDWIAGWFDELPNDLSDVDGFVEDDVRRFFG